MKSFTKWISTAAFLVAALIGSQVQAKTYAGITVDGNKGQSLVLTLIGNDGLESIVSLLATSVDATYTVKLEKYVGTLLGSPTVQRTAIRTYSNGNVVGKGDSTKYRGNFKLDIPGYYNQVSSPSEAGIDSLIISARTIARAQNDEVFTITPKEGSLLTFNNITGQSFNVAVVPEPETYALMAVGLLGLGLARRRKSQGNTLVAA